MNKVKETTNLTYKRGKNEHKSIRTQLKQERPETSSTDTPVFNVASPFFRLSNFR